MQSEIHACHAIEKKHKETRRTSLPLESVSLPVTRKWCMICLEVELRAPPVTAFSVVLFTKAC